MGENPPRSDIAYRGKVYRVKLPHLVEDLPYIQLENIPLHSLTLSNQAQSYSMSTTNPPRPWRGLPDELMVKILEYTLRTNETNGTEVMNGRRSLFSISLLEPLLLTSKHMSKLTLETWGKSKLMIWMPSSRMMMQYIDPKFGRHVRNLSLTMSVPDHLV